MLRHRVVSLTAVLVTCACVLFAAAAMAESEANLAIVDISHDATPFAGQLYENGVRAVGRYFARCFQWQGKQIACNSKAANMRDSPIKVACRGAEFSGDTPEFEALLKKKLGLLSVYQYHSDAKFERPGQWKDKKGDWHTFEDADCRPQKKAHSMETEAELDAEAALAQADFIGQPDGSAIFFGVDFNADNEAVDINIKAYFTVIRRRLSPRFLIGAYGNGRALSLLMGRDDRPGEKLIDRAWINASPGHAGTVEFFNGEKWHLFQTRTDIAWFSRRVRANSDDCVAQFLDTDVQNPATSQQQLGLWRRNPETGRIETFDIDRARTAQIYAHRFFFCNGRAPLLDSTGVPKRHEVCLEVNRKWKMGTFPLSDPYGRTLRVIGAARDDGQIEIDVDDDAQPDGWTAQSNVMNFAKRPDWIKGSLDRLNAKCANN